MKNDSSKKPIPGGYYIKARKIKYSEIAHSPPYVREIWDYLIREANHSGTKKRGQSLNRGQVLTTYDEILEDLHWMVGYRKMKYTKAQCENAMKILRRQGRNGSMITTTKTTRGLLITIDNYCYYQNPKNYESHNESHNDYRTRATREPQSPDTIDKNDKNDKNVKNKKITPLPPKGDNGFDSFWQSYPRHDAKAAAFKAWDKINPSSELIATILQSLENQKQSPQWLKDNGQFIPLPATWLNGCRWEDEGPQIKDWREW